MTDHTDSPMDTHKHEALSRLEQFKAQVDALTAKYEQTAVDPLAAAHEHQAQMAELDRINASLKQTQAALDPARLKTTVAQVRRWAEEETHPNWIWAAYADLAQRLTRVEDRLDDMADSLRMILGQLAALERQDRES
jgi:chromosome segregation ATPase